MPRFVVQQHFRDADDWHFDLMLECKDALVTFSTPVPPDETDRLPCVARQLPNHRLAYLEYQGEISGGRGWCQIHDQGAMEWIEPAETDCPDGKVGETPCDLLDAVAFRLEGRKIKGTFRLTRETASGSDHWRLRKESA